MILFAKAPVPGSVKTRLGSALGPARAAELHRAFVADTIGKLREFIDLADIELHTDILTDAWKEAGVTRQLQTEGDLALKQVHALTEALRAGRPQVMILGSDSPTLPRTHIQRLLDSTADMALGPCEDGGYYAIACRRTDPRMFAGVEWSTRNVLEQTERAALACGLSVERGDVWYDVDEPEDLSRLAAEPELPYHTKRALRAKGESGG
jgi:rSAM/selenodomain-associated transferase 1